MGDYDRVYRTGFRSYGGERKQLEIVVGKVYSANQTQLTPYQPPRPRSPDPSTYRTRGGGGGGGGGGRGSSSSSSGSGWGCFMNDPEMKRRRRVASYKAYSVEGKVKASLRKSLRWIKGKCSELVHGW